MSIRCRSVVLDRFGSTQELHLQEMLVQEPRAGHVRVRVHTAAVNPVDLGTRAGAVIPEASAVFPMVLGWDLSGVVEAAGSDVALPVGTRVAAMSPQPASGIGTYSDLVVLDAALCAVVPDDVDLETAATLPLAGLTAQQALAALALPRGASLLVTGALGGVGRLVTQLASAAGIDVVAASDDADLSRALGARWVVPRKHTLLAASTAELGRPVDAALDLVGGATAQAGIDAVVDGGRYVTSVPQWWVPGGPTRPQRGIAPVEVMTEPDVPGLTELLHRVAEGTLVSPVAARYAFEDAPAAHEHAARRGLRGKIVLAA